jgi:hypothetical protein
MRQLAGWWIVLGLTGLAAAETPRVLFDADDDGADPTPTIKKIVGELDLADAGKARTLRLDAVTTSSWGCACPPFVYAPWASSAPDDAKHTYFYPIVTSGADPGDFMLGSGAGTFELTGKLTKERIDAATWAKRRGRKAPRDTSQAFKDKQPVFAVDSWCFRRARDDDDTWTSTIARMVKRGLPLCT